LAPADISFTASSIDVNLEGLLGNGTFTLDLIPSSPTLAPEPSTLLLVGAGLLTLVAMTWRKKQFA
jgi:PEP-CTERM motif